MKELTKKVELLEYEFTDKQVSPWGGLRLTSAMFALKISIIFLPFWISLMHNSGLCHIILSFA